VAQMRKINFIIEKQRKHKQIMKDVLSKYPQITFRYIPDESGDSATCLSFFGPDETTTRKIVKAFAVNGIDACQYWYDNMFHYIRQWDQIRGMKSTYRMPVHVLDQPQDYANIQFPKSDNIVSRLISMIIKVNWTEEQIKTRITNLEKALDSVFQVL